MRLIAKMPTLAALAYRTSKGLPIVYPRNDLVRGPALVTNCTKMWPCLSRPPVSSRAG
jgi:citrate synthase